VNSPYSVNKKRRAGSALEKALAGKLSEILSGIAWLSQRSAKSARDEPDMVLSLELHGKGRAELHVHFKSDIRPALFQTWAGQRRHAMRGEKAVDVLGAPFVSQRLADVCRQAGWGWYDLSGNCWLDVPGLLRIERTGLPPAHRPPRNRANLSTAAAARVMRALLTPAHAGRTWTQRALQTQTCWKLPNEEPVSLGLVNKVLHYLREQGFVVGTDERGVRVQDPMGLLTAWRDAYRFDRHQRRSFFTLLKGAQLEEALYRTGLEAGGLAAYAAFSAAERQAPQVRQPKTWLYLGADFIDSLAKHAQAKEVDSGENLVVLVPNDTGVFLAFEGDTHVGERRLGCTDPVQTYVDLWHNPSRGEEAAQAVLEQRIRPAWNAVSLK
jgi:hypothetical protein